MLPESSKLVLMALKTMQKNENEEQENAKNNDDAELLSRSKVRFPPLVLSAPGAAAAECASSRRGGGGAADDSDNCSYSRNSKKRFKES